MARVMTTEKLQLGSVVQYAYLWQHDRAKGVEYPKDRPACIVLKLDVGQGLFHYALAAISDQKPTHPHDGFEIPLAEIKRGGLNVSRTAYIHLTEINLDSTYNSVALHYRMPIRGRLSGSFVQKITKQLIENIKMKRTVIVRRQET
jgi:hypothetical protein